MSDRRVQLWSIYAAFGFIAIVLIGWVALTGFVSPNSPAAGAQEIARPYRDRLIGIRVGMVMSIFASALLLHREVPSAPRCSASRVPVPR